MKIGIVGSGIVGRTLGTGFLAHGHEVMLGSRDPGKGEVPQWLQENPGAQGGTFAEVAAFGDLILLAVKGTVAESALNLAGAGNLAGKTILDATNPLADKPPVNGVLEYTTGPNQSLAEKLQAQVPRSHIVKAFNSVGAGRMVNPKFAQGPPTMFLCGDNVVAKAQVEALILELGWHPFDCGGITSARALEPLCMLWCLPGFLRNQWTHAFKLLVE